MMIEMELDRPLAAASTWGAAAATQPTARPPMTGRSQSNGAAFRKTASNSVAPRMVAMPTRAAQCRAAGKPIEPGRNMEGLGHVE